MTAIHCGSCYHELNCSPTRKSMSPIHLSEKFSFSLETHFNEAVMLCNATFYLLYYAVPTPVCTFSCHGWFLKLWSTSTGWAWLSSSIYNRNNILHWLWQHKVWLGPQSILENHAALVIGLSFYFSAFLLSPSSSACRILYCLSCFSCVHNYHH